MRLRLLQMFCEVVRTHSFSAAAQVTNATQSTVSKAVRQLEEEIGAELIDRTASPMRLTPAGDIVWRHALTILDEAQRIRLDLDDLRGLRRGELRLGLPPLGSASLFAPLFAIYRARHPLIDIRLLEHGSRRLEELLLAGEVELAATLMPVSEVFDFQPVRREPLVAVVPADHALAAQPQIHLRDLKDTPFIFFDAAFALNEQLRKACQTQGFEPSEGARSGQVDFIIALVAAGQGIAFLPRLMTRQQPPSRQVRFVPMVPTPGMEWNLTLAWRRGSQLSAAAQAWLALAKEKIQWEEV